MLRVRLSTPFCILTLLGCLLTVAEAAKCYALALSGGGDKGAFEAGAIRGLTNVLPQDETAWQVVTGISAGSIITAGCGIYAVGDEKEMADFLVNTSVGLTQAKIYKDWPGGILEGLTLKSGLYDSSPERELVASVIRQGFKGRKLTIGATSDSSGMLVTWNETQWSAPDGGDFLDGVMASSAIPGIFPTVKWGGQTFSDGGTSEGVNVFDAVVRCQEMGFSESDIVVDIIATAGSKIEWSDKAEDDTTLAVMMRNNDIKKVNSLMDDVTHAKLAYPSVVWRYLIYPSVKLPGNGINFNRTEMELMVTMGESDAQAAVSNYPRNCPYETAQVECESDRECINWAAATCQSVLGQKYCKSNKFCHFAL